MFTITIDKELSTALTINLVTSGTATNGTDMNAMATSVTIPAGDTDATAAIPVTSDAIAEGTETVTLTLGSNSGCTRWCYRETTILIMLLLLILPITT